MAPLQDSLDFKVPLLHFLWLSVLHTDHPACFSPHFWNFQLCLNFNLFLTMKTRASVFLTLKRAIFTSQPPMFAYWDKPIPINLAEYFIYIKRTRLSTAFPPWTFVSPAFFFVFPEVHFRLLSESVYSICNLWPQTNVFYLSFSLSLFLG